MKYISSDISKSGCYIVKLPLLISQFFISTHHRQFVYNKQQTQARFFSCIDPATIGFYLLQVFTPHMSLCLLFMRMTEVLLHITSPLMKRTVLYYSSTIVLQFCVLFSFLSHSKTVPTKYPLQVSTKYSHPTCVTLDFLQSCNNIMSRVDISKGSFHCPITFLLFQREVFQLCIVYTELEVLRQI